MWLFGFFFTRVTDSSGLFLNLIPIMTLLASFPCHQYAIAVWAFSVSHYLPSWHPFTLLSDPPWPFLTHTTTCHSFPLTTSNLSQKTAPKPVTAFTALIPILSLTPPAQKYTFQHYIPLRFPTTQCFWQQNDLSHRILHPWSPHAWKCKCGSPPPSLSSKSMHANIQRSAVLLRPPKWSRDAAGVCVRMQAICSVLTGDGVNARVEPQEVRKSFMFCSQAWWWAPNCFPSALIKGTRW